jgi:hypothetical protein
LLDDVGVSGRITVDVFNGAILMQIQWWMKIGTVALLGTSVALATSWWAGQRPYITPGAHQVFRMDSTPGALLEFLVLMIMAGVGLGALASARARWLFAGIAASYMAAIMLVSLLTPRTIVSIGDSYCWDLWCLGIQNVRANPQGQNVLYTAEVSLFVDSTTAQLELTDQPKRPFYVVDEEGHRFPIVAYSSLGASKVTVKPGESVKSSLTFLAPANARSLYLTGDIEAPLWVRLYFGSDLNPFHRRTLLRVV